MSPDALPPLLRVDPAPHTLLLTEDRALLTRRGPIAWDGGPLRLELSGLSPVLVDSSVQVAIRGDGSPISVGDVRVIRRWVPLSRPAEQSADAIGREAREVADALAEVQGQLEGAQNRQNRVYAELERYVAMIARNVGLGLPMDTARVERDLSLLQQRLNEGPERAEALRGARREAKRRLADVRAMLQAIETGQLRLESTITIAVDAPPGPTRAELELRYLLPNAMWRPSYEAHLDSARGAVTWSVQAMVWQRSGEDWREVRVSLSTARPSAGAALPPLHQDTLFVRPKTPEERRTVQADFRDQTVQSAALTSGDGPAALPGVDDGGETHLLQSEGLADLPSDGRPHRVHVSRFVSPASTRWLCVPEREESVVREVTLENRGAQPLLAGPVVLLLDGAYLGVGDIPFVAPGERFPLSFGSSDDVVVRYERRRKTEKRTLQSDLTWFIAETTLHHTGGAPMDLELLMRVPVSELEKVSVVRALEHTRAGAEGPDEHGHLRWKIRLQPGSRELASLGFRLELSGGVQLPDPW